ncbi:MAG: hypothetical protein KGQ88_06560, partial [Chloroflexi bacterium]|nr:hypothetical protein [Chloroflexota bacterium]
RAVVIGNTFVGTGASSWGMEYGNSRDGSVEGNSFTNCDVGIAQTGEPGRYNDGNTFSDNTFANCPTPISGPP